MTATNLKLQSSGMYHMSLNDGLHPHVWINSTRRNGSVRHSFILHCTSVLFRLYVQAI